MCSGFLTPRGFTMTYQEIIEMLRDIQLEQDVLVQEDKDPTESVPDYYLEPEKELDFS